MIKTISIGKYISVQGNFVRTLPNGKMTVRVGERMFTGTPVSPATA